MIMELLKRNRVCQHDKVTPEVDFAYCPDCGELIENQWFIMRCACCGVKVRAMIKNGEIVAKEKFCHNCGSSIYTVDKIDKINFIDVNYAVLVKKVVTHERPDITQSWVDPTQKANEIRLLLQQYQ